MVARLQNYLRNSTSFQTYRFVLSDLTTTTNAGANGLYCEVFGIDNAHVKLRHVQFSKPSLDVAPFLINAYSIGSSTTASTGTTRISPVNIGNFTGSSYAGEVRFYTSFVSPSTGTLVDQFQEIDILTTDVMNEHYGDDQGKVAPTLRGSSESYGFAITSTGGTVLNGYVEMTVEP